MAGKKPKMGSRWRILAHKGKKDIALENEGVFDEVVVDDWLHLEQMDTNLYWLKLGDCVFWVHQSKKGSVEVLLGWTEERPSQNKKEK